MLMFLEFVKQKISVLHPDKPKVNHTKYELPQREPDLKGDVTDKNTAPKNLTNKRLPRAKKPPKPKKTPVPNANVINKRTATLRSIKQKTTLLASHQKDMQKIRRQKLDIEKKKQQEFQKIHISKY